MTDEWFDRFWSMDQHLANLDVKKGEFVNVTRIVGDSASSNVRSKLMIRGSLRWYSMFAWRRVQRMMQLLPRKIGSINFCRASHHHTT